jgi:hypothetical protein
VLSTQRQCNFPSQYGYTTLASHLAVIPSDRKSEFYIAGRNSIGSALRLAPARPVAYNDVMMAGGVTPCMHVEYPISLIPFGWSGRVPLAPPAIIVAVADASSSSSCCCYGGAANRLWWCGPCQFGCCCHRPLANRRRHRATRTSLIGQQQFHAHACWHGNKTTTALRQTATLNAFQHQLNGDAASPWAHCECGALALNADMSYDDCCVMSCSWK